MPDYRDSQSNNPGSLYSVSEFVAFARRLGSSPECVKAALLDAGVSFATLDQAINIVSNFLKTEVI